MAATSNPELLEKERRWGRWGRTRVLLQEGRGVVHFAVHHKPARLLARVRLDLGHCEQLRAAAAGRGGAAHRGRRLLGEAGRGRSAAGAGVSGASRRAVKRRPRLKPAQHSERCRGAGRTTSAAAGASARFIQPPTVPAAMVGCSNCSPNLPSAAGWMDRGEECECERDKSAHGASALAHRAACRGRQRAQGAGSGGGRQGRGRTGGLAGVDLHAVAAVVHHAHQVPARKKKMER